MISILVFEAYIPPPYSVVEGGFVVVWGAAMMRFLEAGFKLRSVDYFIARNQ